MDLTTLIYLLIVINPFAQTQYLWELIEEMSLRDFASVYWRASLLSFGVFVLFALVGEWLIIQVFQIELTSLQMFGGLILLMIGFRVVVNSGGKARVFEDRKADLAPRIALPYLIGPGTIWISILIGEQLPLHLAAAGIGGTLAVNLISSAWSKRSSRCSSTAKRLGRASS